MRILRIENENKEGPFCCYNRPFNDDDGFNYDNRDIWPNPAQDELDEYKYSNYLFAVPDLDMLLWWFEHCHEKISNFFVVEYDAPDTVIGASGVQVVFNPITAKEISRIKVGELFS